MGCTYPKEVRLLQISGISTTSFLKSGGIVTYTTHRQFLHDEPYYPDPDKFDPSRYSRSKESGLNEDDYNPLNVVFGFGRR